MLISEYHRVDGNQANVYMTEGNEPFIIYFDKNGQIINSEKFPGKSMNYVQDAAENYALGVKNDIG